MILAMCSSTIQDVNSQEVRVQRKRKAKLDSKRKSFTTLLEHPLQQLSLQCGILHETAKHATTHPDAVSNVESNDADDAFDINERSDAGEGTSEHGRRRRRQIH